MEQNQDLLSEAIGRKEPYKNKIKKSEVLMRTQLFRNSSEVCKGQLPHESPSLSYLR